MKTRMEVKCEVMQAKIGEWLLHDQQSSTPGMYRPYIESGSALALAGMVKRLAKDEYLVRMPNGTQITVNGNCTCGDVIAPSGWCQHRIAQRLEYEALLHLDVIKRSMHCHGYICKHLADVECWDVHCQMPRSVYCPTCEEGTAGPLEYAQVAEASMYETSTPPVTPTLVPVASVPEDTRATLLPEAPVSLCVKMRLPGNHEMSYTLRGHDDAGVLARLPMVLAGLERQVDPGTCESGWLHRIYQAFLPVSMRKAREEKP